MNLQKLEQELNKAHKDYLQISKNFSVKTKEYKDARNIYLEKASTYQQEFYKEMRKNNVNI